MRSSVTSNVVLAGLVAGLVSVYGCGGGGGGGGNPFTNSGTSGSTGSGSSGTTGTSAGTAGSGTGGAAGSASMGSAGSGSGNAGSGTGTAGAGGQAGTSATAGSGGGAGGAAGATGGAGGQMATGAGGASMGPLGDITKVVPSSGCGMDTTIMPNKTTQFNIMTTGVKDMNCADHTATCAPGPTCGPTPWMYNREYFVTLPAGYDKTKAYPLVFEGPGCGGNGQAVYPLTYMGANNVNNTVIRVGLTPPPNAIGHATNPCQGCFDDKEGDDSVDWGFYETLYDHLASTLCFDRNRVFSTGNSSGAWFSNEVGCKYAGDSKRPIRGVLPNTGGLPNQPMYEPTCTNAPMAGMWIGETMDPENPFTGNEFAITRAMGVNGCAQTNFNAAVYANFPIGGGNADTVCKQIQNCPALYPLVVCLIPGNQHAGHDNVANPGFSTFLTMFQKAPLLTQ